MSSVWRREVLSDSLATMVWAWPTHVHPITTGALESSDLLPGHRCPLTFWLEAVAIPTGCCYEVYCDSNVHTCMMLNDMVIVDLRWRLHCRILHPMFTCVIFEVYSLRIIIWVLYVMYHVHRLGIQLLLLGSGYVTSPAYSPVINVHIHCRVILYTLLMSVSRHKWAALCCILALSFIIACGCKILVAVLDWLGWDLI